MITLPLWTERLFGNKARRRAVRFSGQAEPCELRTLLSATAFSHSATSDDSSPHGKDEKQKATPPTVDVTDFWKSTIENYDLTQKGAKIRGTVHHLPPSGFQTSVKGKIDGDHLVFKYKVPVTISTPEGMTHYVNHITIDVNRVNNNKFTGTWSTESKKANPFSQAITMNRSP